MVLPRRTSDNQMDSNVYYLGLFWTLKTFWLVFCLCCLLDLGFCLRLLLPFWEHMAIGLRIFCFFISSFHIDISDNDLTIIDDMPFVWWSFNLANSILCTWWKHHAIHLFYINMPLSSWYSSNWKPYCLHIPSKYFLPSIISSFVDVFWNLFR